MNVLARWLAEGDLDSEGRVDEVTDIVLENPVRIEELLECFNSENPVVRGHAADAAEKIGREKPEIFLPYMHILFRTALEDSVGLVKQHLAILFGHTVVFSELVDPNVAALFKLLDSQHNSTKIWAITSLCIVAKLYPEYKPRVLGEISQLEESPKKPVRVRARKALEILTEDADLPDGWVKSLPVQAMIENE